MVCIDVMEAVVEFVSYQRCFVFHLGSGFLDYLLDVVVGGLRNNCLVTMGVRGGPITKAQAFKA